MNHKSGNAETSATMRVANVDAMAAAAGVPPGVLQLLQRGGIVAGGAAAGDANRATLRLLGRVLALGLPALEAVRLIWGPHAMTRQDAK